MEKMEAFFEARLDGYDEHMLSNIESAREFYLLPLGVCRWSRMPEFWIWATAWGWSWRNTSV